MQKSNYAEADHSLGGGVLCTVYRSSKTNVVYNSIAISVTPLMPTQFTKGIATRYPLIYLPCKLDFWVSNLTELEYNVYILH